MNWSRGKLIPCVLSLCPIIFFGFIFLATSLTYGISVVGTGMSPALLP